ncbi:LysR family transcriptional regulator, partial [Bacteroides thetaiotaomicron]
MENRFIRAEEVADELGVSRPYAYKRIRELKGEWK